MDFFRISCSSTRQMPFLFVLWFTVGIVLFFLAHKQGQEVARSSKLGRDLLQQDAVDYNELTTLRQRKKLLDMKVKIDNNPTLSEKDVLKTLLPYTNLPSFYWKYSKPEIFTKSKCLKFPKLYDLEFNNIYWQKLTTSSSTFYLFGAYYDKRERVGTIPVVRIIGMVNKIDPPSVFCQFWYDDNTKAAIPEHLMYSKAYYAYMWYKEWGNYKDGVLQPFILSCPVRKIGNKSFIPTSVSLVETYCAYPTNNLKVIYKNPIRKENFAVCVKGLDFLYEDISVKLVEWIELLHILGAKKIFLYELEMHPNISKVLNYYIEKDMVELTPLTLPGEQPNLQGFRHLYLKSKVVNKRQNELIPYNDCLYKNLYSYKYIALLDTDEVIMPLVHDNWNDMMSEILRSSQEVLNVSQDSYNFRNAYFLDALRDGNEMLHTADVEGIPNYLHMLTHVYRSKNYTKPLSYVKCFHNTEQVVYLHNHFPMHCFGPCTTYSVDTSMAHLQHYREDCVGSLKKNCEDFKKFTVLDTSIWRFKNELVRRTTETLFDLGFIGTLKISKKN